MAAKVKSTFSARKLANRLKNDSGFYETASITAKNNFFSFFSEKQYIYSMKQVMEEVMSNE